MMVTCETSRRGEYLPVNDITSVVDNYIQIWNETDQQSRRALIAQVFAEDVLYSDPLASVRGHAAIDQLISGAQTQFAGLRFSLAGPIDAHHDQARFSWHLGLPEAEDPIVIGFDVAILQNARIQSVYGFLDKVPTG
jgi:hypothetical protein